ncbi:MAG: alpha-hydroxy-acid oxidizing protein [Gemmatimonadota bacterium]|nr:alpha-hydroxy-acid oxidizing protein [Gemmatimonadota bacterium]
MTAPVNLSDLEALARERLPQMVYDYYAGGANDEVSVAENRRAWEAVRLRPRVLANVASVDPSTTVLGRRVEFPVLTAPCGFNGLAHPEGERAVARAAAAAGVIQVVSTAATTTLEDVAAAAPGGHRWFQLYCYRDREVTRSLVQRAEAAGYEALCITVDVPYLGRREREIRNGFHLPPGVTLRNLEPYAAAEMAASERDSALAKYVNALWDPSLDWSAIDWLRSITRLPVVLKGVLAEEDAKLAAEHGAAGVIVSNHGGRQLDGAVGPVYALREVMQAVGDRLEVYVDGGIRRGWHVVAALAMGARAVLIGRPYLWGLAVDGEAGVQRVLETFRNEVVLAMALAGRRRVADVDGTLIAG